MIIVNIILSVTFCGSGRIWPHAGSGVVWSYGGSQGNAMQDEARKMKILHVLGGLNRGGAETWLMHVLRHIDRDRFQFDFLVHTEKKCAYDDEARELGARIIPNPDPSNPFLYAANFIRNYRKYGPYDVVHSHVHHYSGFVLFLAKTCGVPKRIAHSHNDTRPAESGAGVWRRTYLKVMERFIRIFATSGVAASRKAAEALYGANWENDMRWSVLYCGIDLEEFTGNDDIEEIKNELGLPICSSIIGHVGSFVETKNHSFLIDIAEEVFRRLPNSYLLLVGDGALRKEIEMKVREKGMEERVIFTGVREDIPRLMRAMDVFVMPSLYEGLPVVLIEAQASRVPCVISDSITAEADIIREMVCGIGLREPPTFWAEKVMELRGRKVDCSKGICLQAIRESPFNIENSVRALCSLYCDENINS